MRRMEIIVAARSVDRLLQETGIDALAAGAAAAAGSGDGLGLADRIFDGYGRALPATARLTAAERHVLQVYDLAGLLDRGWWRQAMTEAAAGRAGGLHALHRRIVSFRENLPRATALFAPQTIAGYVDGGPERHGRLDSLLLLLIEDAQHKSTPERLIAALSSTGSLYRMAARLRGRDEGDLTVMNCDSGADKSIELIGLREVIDDVRGIILSVYRRAAVYADLQGPARLERILADLPVLQQLAGLGAEQAEIFRRNLAQAVGDFVAAGTIIPEMLDIAGPAARQVMAPERKLLAQPVGGTRAEGSGLDELRDMLAALRRERDALVAALPPERRESLQRRLAAEGLG